MNGTEAVITILGLGILITGASAWKSYLNAKNAVREFEIRIAMSKAETNRFEIMASRAMKIQNPIEGP